MEELSIRTGIEVPDYLARLDGHFVELLDKLERIAVVMERFDNVMNPSLDLAQEAFRAQMDYRPGDPLGQSPTE